MKGKTKIWCLVIASLTIFLIISPAVAKDLLIFTNDQAPAGTLFAQWDLTLTGCQQYGFVTEVLDADCKDVDIEAGDINIDAGWEEDSLAVRFANKLEIYNYGDDYWKWVSGAQPWRVTVGNVRWDEKLEIIGTYDTGVYYFWCGAITRRCGYRQITSYGTNGDIAAGDINGDGLDEVAVVFPSGTWYWNPANNRWTKITSFRAYNLAAGDMNGDGRAEIVGAFSTGIWSWDDGTWRKLTDDGYVTDGDITLGDFDGNGRDDLASCWPSGVLWVLWDDGIWERIIGCDDDMRAEKITTGKMR